MNFCGNCGTPTSAGGGFCSGCGKAIDGAAQSGSPAVKRSRNKLFIIIGAVVAVILLGQFVFSGNSIVGTWYYEGEDWRGVWFRLEKQFNRNGTGVLRQESDGMDFEDEFDWLIQENRLYFHYHSGAFNGCFFDVSRNTLTIWYLAGDDEPEEFTRVRR